MLIWSLMSFVHRSYFDLVFDIPPEVDADFALIDNIFSVGHRGEAPSKSHRHHITHFTFSQLQQVELHTTVR